MHRVATIVAVLVLSAPALAAPHRACRSGHFQVADAPLLADQAAGVDLVVLEQGTVSIASGCPPVRARVKRASRGTTVKAGWKACGLAGPVRLKARIDRGCVRMAGVLSSQAADLKRRFQATRIISCGNGVREADEACDDGNTADGDCCSAACALEDASACAPERCTEHADCAADAYCARDGCRGDGTCRQRPQACIGVLEPVCGCDGRTYVNACEAARAGIGLRADGRCDRTCGTIRGIPCPAGKFCEHPPRTCEIADGSGTCVAIPEACVLRYAPVCGCDGVTYDNDCERRAAEAQKAHDGPCDCVPIGCEPGSVPHDTDGDGCSDTCASERCASNADCGDDAYCAARPGDCTTAGVCANRPSGCPRIHQPVCGCDGKTYPTACVAAAAGVRVAAEGACLCPAILCAPGTRPVDLDGDGCDDACRAYCRKPCDCYLNPDLEFPTPCARLCPTCDNYWVCEDGRCADRCGPVPPGQDECPGPPACATNTDCEPKQYCAKTPGQCEARGTCQPTGEACPAIHAPVCGCDGKTYGSPCEATLAGVNIASRGPCPAVCGTITGIPCADGQFCELPAGTCEGADLGGICVEVTRQCPEFYSPVCGCDGQTYGNDCERRGAKVQKAHNGACGPACRETCDCYAHPFREPCPALCPACGNYWVCQAGECREECGPVPPQLACTAQ